MGTFKQTEALAGAKVKVPVYFIMGVFAAQIIEFPYEYAYVASSMIYGILFFVESGSAT